MSPPRWRVDDSTPICSRVELMENLAAESVAYPSVKKLAADVIARSQALMARSPVHTGDWKQRILAAEALRAAQSVQYKSDIPDQEWVQRADYTIANGGECKALSVLFVAICKIVGLQAEIIWITQTGRPINHVSARVYLDSEWLWADASMRGAMVGESPYDAVNRLEAHHVVGGPVPVKPAAATEAPRQIAPASWQRHWLGWPMQWWETHYDYASKNYARILWYPTENGFYRVKRS